MKLKKAFLITLYSLFLVISLLDLFDKVYTGNVSPLAMVVCFYAFIINIVMIVLSSIGIVRMFKETKHNVDLNLVLITTCFYIFRIILEHIVYRGGTFKTFDVTLALLRVVSLILIFIALGLPYSKNKTPKLIISLTAMSLFALSTIYYMNYNAVLYGSIWGFKYIQSIFHYPFLVIIIFLISIQFNEKYIDIPTTKKSLVVQQVSSVDPITENLNRVKSLYEEGILTKEEYESKRKEIITKL